MLRHELSSHKGRLLLSVLMLKDAGRNHDAVPSVDPVVSHESRHSADDGHEALIHNPARFARVGHTLVAPHCNVHRFRPPLPKRAGPVSPAVLINEVQCEGLEGQTQLPRTPLLGRWVNNPYARRHPMTSGVPFTSKPILGGSTLVTPPRCSTRSCRNT